MTSSRLPSLESHEKILHMRYQLILISVLRRKSSSGSSDELIFVMEAALGRIHFCKTLELTPKTAKLLKESGRNTFESDYLRKSWWL